MRSSRENLSFFKNFSSEKLGLRFNKINDNINPILTVLPSDLESRKTYPSDQGSR